MPSTRGKAKARPAPVTAQMQLEHLGVVYHKNMSDWAANQLVRRYMIMAGEEPPLDGSVDLDVGIGPAPRPVEGATPRPSVQDASQGSVSTPRTGGRGQVDYAPLYQPKLNNPIKDMFSRASEAARIETPTPLPALSDHLRLPASIGPILGGDEEETLHRKPAKRPRLGAHVLKPEGGDEEETLNQKPAKRPKLGRRVQLKFEDGGRYWQEANGVITLDGDDDDDDTVKEEELYDTTPPRTSTSRATNSTRSTPATSFLTTASSISAVAISSLTTASSSSTAAPSSGFGSFAVSKPTSTAFAGSSQALQYAVKAETTTPTGSFVDELHTTSTLPEGVILKLSVLDLAATSKGAKKVHGIQATMMLKSIFKTYPKQTVVTPLNPDQVPAPDVHHFERHASASEKCLSLYPVFTAEEYFILKLTEEGCSTNDKPGNLGGLCARLQDLGFSKKSLGADLVRHIKTRLQDAVRDLTTARNIYVPPPVQNFIPVQNSLYQFPGLNVIAAGDWWQRSDTTKPIPGAVLATGFNHTHGCWLAKMDAFYDEELRASKADQMFWALRKLDHTLLPWGPDGDIVTANPHIKHHTHPLAHCIPKIWDGFGNDIIPKNSSCTSTISVYCRVHHRFEEASMSRLGIFGLFAGLFKPEQWIHDVVLTSSKIFDQTFRRQEASHTCGNGEWCENAITCLTFESSYRNQSRKPCHAAATQDPDSVCSCWSGQTYQLDLTSETVTQIKCHLDHRRLNRDDLFCRLEIIRREEKKLGGKCPLCNARFSVTNLKDLKQHLADVHGYRAKSRFTLVNIDT